MINLSGSDSINQILAPDQNSFEVPLYQRRYVWGKTNWNKLWGDIVEQVNIDATERGVGHFTGPIVTRSIDGEQNKYEVIDGQQRLTTLQIIFCVIKDLCEGVNGLQNRDVVDEAKKHVQDRSNNHKLTLTKYDQTTFKKIVKGEVGKSIHIHEAFDETENDPQAEKIKEVISDIFDDDTISSNILDAYRFFYKEIRSHLQENQEDADNLLSVIISDFKLIHLSLDETEGAEAEKVFESINATGRMLSDFDYLRNNLFLRTRELGKNEDGKLYRDVYYNDPKYWPFEKEDWTAKKQKSFLRAFLMAAWDPKCLEEENAKPFVEYQEYSKSLKRTDSDDTKKILYEFEQLSKWAKSYQKLQVKKEFKDYKDFCDDLSLRDLDSFLLFVEHTNSEQLSDVTKILESYIVRSLLVLENKTCRHVDIKKNCFKTIGFFFSNAIGGNFCKNSFVQHLIDQSPSHIDNDAVSDVFWGIGVYGNKNAAFITYVLDRIMQENPVMPLENFNWAQHQILITDITEYLSDNTNHQQLNHNFHAEWPELN